MKASAPAPPSFTQVPRDVGAITEARRTGVEQERLRLRFVAAVADVMENRCVTTLGDDILVRRLGIVLARDIQVEQVQIELGVVAARKGFADRLVAERRAAIRLRETRDLVRRFLDAQAVERVEQRLRVLAFGGNTEAVGVAGVVADPVNDLAGRQRRAVGVDHLEHVLERDRLRRRRPLPEVLRLGPEEPRRLVGRDQEKAAGFVERHPVVKERRRPHRPVLVVVRRLLLGRPRMNEHGVAADLAHRLGVNAPLMRDMLGIQRLDRSEMHARRLARCFVGVFVARGLVGGGRGRGLLARVVQPIRVHQRNAIRQARCDDDDRRRLRIEARGSATGERQHEDPDPHATSDTSSGAPLG